jgi:hypothetical protein
MDLEIFEVKLAIQRLEGKMESLRNEQKRQLHQIEENARMINIFEVKFARLGGYAAGAGAAVAIISKIIEHIWK